MKLPGRVLFSTNSVEAYRKSTVYLLINFSLLLIELLHVTSYNLLATSYTFNILLSIIQQILHRQIKG